jgi:hypothetical protein
LSPQLIVVPAYFSLDTKTDPSQPTDWARIQNASGWVGLIVAGNVFEGASAPNTDLRNAPTTQTTYGYVFTGSGRQPVVTAVRDVTQWYSSYGSTRLQGIFFDVGPTFDPNQISGVTAAYEASTIQNAFGMTGYTFPGFESYYSQLYSTVHNTFNGQVMVNAAQWPDEWLISPSSGTQGADKVLVWEDNLAHYDNNWGAMPCGSTTGPCTGNVQSPPPAWWSSFAYTSSYGIGHIIFAATQYDMSGAVRRSWTPAENRTASLLYVHDRPQAVYDGVACYFEQEINALGGNLSGPSTTWCGSCVNNTCTGSCTDISTDVENCGSCGNQCAGNGYICSFGNCTCPQGYTDCGDSCAPPHTNCL